MKVEHLKQEQETGLRQQDTKWIQRTEELAAVKWI
jgi:hypothetical protein